MPIALTREELAPDHIRDKLYRFLYEGLPKVVNVEDFDWSTGKGALLDRIAILNQRFEEIRKQKAPLANVWKNWLRTRTALFEALENGMWVLESIQREVKRAGVMPDFIGKHLVIQTPDEGFLCFKTGGIVAVSEVGKPAIRIPVCEKCHPVEYAHIAVPEEDPVSMTA